MTKKKRLYLSVLIPTGIFLAVVLIGAAYMLAISPYVGSQNRWLDGPPKEASTYSLAFHFLEELFSWGNFVRLTAFSAALGFALWCLFAKRRNRSASVAFTVFLSGFGIVLSAIPLLFAILIPVSDTMAFAVLGLAEILDTVVYPLGWLSFSGTVILSAKVFISACAEGCFSQKEAISS